MDVVLICARAGLALVFIVAGVGKLLDLPGSRVALQGFGVPAKWAVPGGWLLPIVELAAAAALLAQPTARVGAGAALLLLAAFCLGIANALHQGRAPDCHCFGQLHSAPAGRGAIVRNLALAVPAGMVVVAGPGDALGTGAEGAALVAITALAAALAAATATLLRENRWLRRGTLTGAPEPLEIGAPVPELSLRDAQGSTLAIGEVIDSERPSVLVFVQPGCGACTALLPRLERWRPALAERVALVVISGPASIGGPTGEEAAAAPHILWDIENAAMAAYRLVGAPGAVQVNPDRTIASAPALGNQTIEALIRVARHRRRPASRQRAAA